MRRVIFWGTVVTILSLFALAWSFANFQFVFLAPAATLLLVQGVSFSEMDKVNKNNFFTITDYIYYLGVGAILGVGSHFLSGLDEILRYDATMTYQDAKAQLPKVSERLEAARYAATQGSKFIASIDTKVMSRCMVEQSLLQRGINGEDSIYSLTGPKVPPGCEVILGPLDSWVRAIHDANVLSSKKSQIQATINAGPPTSGVSSFLSQDTIAWLLYKLFPALLLCGVTLKIGKTTNGILK